MRVRSKHLNDHVCWWEHYGCCFLDHVCWWEHYGCCFLPLKTRLQPIYSSARPSLAFRYNKRHNDQTKSNCITWALDSWINQSNMSSPHETPVIMRQWEMELDSSFSLLNLSMLCFLPFQLYRLIKWAVSLIRYWVSIRLRALRQMHHPPTQPNNDNHSIFTFRPCWNTTTQLSVSQSRRP